MPHLTQGKLAVSWPQPLCCHELGRAAAWVPFGEGHGLENSGCLIFVFVKRKVRKCMCV